MKNKWFIVFPILIFIAALAVGAVGYFGIVYKKSTDSTGSPRVDGGGRVACTQEAKLCPDGSTVGRTGPNCEFAECPTLSPELVEGDTASWQTYRNEEYGFEVKYPGDWYFKNITQDPSDDIKVADSITTFDSMPILRNRQAFRLPDRGLKILIGDSSYTKAISCYRVSDQNSAIFIGGKSYAGCQIEFGIKFFSTSFIHDDVSYHITYPSETVDTNTINQILSTFKFIEPTKTSPSTSSGDKTPPSLTASYINNKHLFGFKYPEGHIPYIAVDKENGFILPAGVDAYRVVLAEDQEQIFSGIPKTLEFGVIQEDISTLDWLAGNLQRYIPSAHIVSQKDITFAGRKAVEVIGSGLGGSAYKLIVVKPGNFSITIAQSAKSDFLDAVLKTFTFDVRSLR